MCGAASVRRAPVPTTPPPHRPRSQWIKQRCISAEQCADLHIWDLDKLPACKWGKSCSDDACILNHKPDEEKPECINYRLGFCSFGAACEYRHARRPRSELPAISELWLAGGAVDLALIESAKRSAAAGVLWRVSMCKYMLEFKWCPWFDNCKYSHSERDRTQQAMAAARTTAPARAPVGAPAAGAGRPAPSLPLAPLLQTALSVYESVAASLRATENMPDLSSARHKFFIVRASTALNLLQSLRTLEWLVTAQSGDLVAAALRSTAESADGSSGGGVGAGSVFLFFSALNTKHIQGIARLKGPPRAWEGAAVTGVDATGLADESRVTVLPIEWVRTCALPMLRTVNLHVPFGNGGASSAPLPAVSGAAERDVLELTPPLGRALTMLAYYAEYIRPPGETAPLAAGATFAVLDPLTNDARAALRGEDLGGDVVDALRNKDVANRLSSLIPPPTANSAAPIANAPPAFTGNRQDASSRANIDPTANFTSHVPSVQPWATPGVGCPRLTEAMQLLLGTPSTAGPGPVTPFIATLLEGRAPPNAPPPEHIAADAVLHMGRKVMLLATNNVSGPLTIARGVIVASDDSTRPGVGARKSVIDLQSIAAGTPIVALNLHTRSLHGVFLARGPVVRDLIPDLLPAKMSAGRVFPMHIPIMVLAEPAPLPESVFGAFFGPRGIPGHIGYLEPQQGRDVICAMLATLEPSLLAKVAGLSQQMCRTGAFPWNCDQSGASVPLGPGGTPVAVSTIEPFMSEAPLMVMVAPPAAQQPIAPAPGSPPPAIPSPGGGGGRGGPPQSSGGVTSDRGPSRSYPQPSRDRDREGYRGGGGDGGGDRGRSRRSRSRDRDERRGRDDRRR